MNPLKERVYYPGLDALRGIAIILVVGYHYFSFFRIGWIGVDLFFVLSGFLITTILLKSRGQKNYFKNFYIRRALRIFPLYYFVLLLFYLCLNFFIQSRGTQTVYEYYTQNYFWFLTFTQNWLIIKEGPPPEPYLIHFWSLGLEEQFYIVWPLVIYGIKNVKIIQNLLFILFFMALSLRLYLWFSPMGNQAYYYNSLARFDSLAAGAFLAIKVYRSQKISGLFIWTITLAFSIIILLAFLVFKNFDHDSFLFATIGYSTSSLFFMTTCFIAITKHSFILKNSYLKNIGHLSYGIYVYHLPVFLTCNFFLRKIDLFSVSKTITLLFIPMVCIFITLLISVVSYRLLELPLLKFKNRFT